MRRIPGRDRKAGAVVDQASTGGMDDGGRLPERRFKTLVVDDEPDLADMAAELLTYHGIDAMVAYSAPEALKLLAAHADIDAIFSDIMMPGMTGLDLAETVATNYPRIRIVLTSGFTTPAYWKQQHGQFPFVTKPYLINTVIKLLKP